MYRGPPDSPEKKTRGKGSGVKRNVCVHERCAYSNGEPGTGLELDKTL